MKTMTIAQSLRRIKSLKGKLAELTPRANASVSYESKTKPVFDFKATRVELASVREQLVTLEAAVAKANAITTVKYDGKEMTIAEAIRRLQEFKSEMSWLPQLVLRDGTFVSYENDYDENTGRSVRRKVETVFISDLKEVERVAELQKLRDAFEALNDAVESANHRTSVEWTEPSS